MTVVVKLLKSGRSGPNPNRQWLQDCMTERCLFFAGHSVGGYRGPGSSHVCLAASRSLVVVAERSPTDGVDLAPWLRSLTRTSSKTSWEECIGGVGGRFAFGFRVHGDVGMGVDSLGLGSELMLGVCAM